MCEREDQYCDYGYYDNKDFLTLIGNRKSLSEKISLKNYISIKFLIFLSFSVNVTEFFSTKDTNYKNVKLKATNG